jgi:hypothetical protein
MIITIHLGQIRGREAWTLRANWRGAVAVFFDLRGDTSRDKFWLAPDVFFTDVVRPGIEAAIDLTEALGGFGRAHLVLRLQGAGFYLQQGNFRGNIPSGKGLMVRTWTDDRGQLSDEASSDSSATFFAHRGLQPSSPKPLRQKPKRRRTSSSVQVCCE